MNLKCQILSINSLQADVAAEVQTTLGALLEEVSKKECKYIHSR